MVREPLAALPPGRVTSVTILLLATWIGLIAGYLDLGIMVIHKRLAGGVFYRLGSDFPWLIPVGVTILVLVPAIVLVLIARLRGQPVRLGLAVWLLSLVGFLDTSVRLPMSMWASLLLSVGIASQLARLASRRRPAFLRVIRVTVPVLVLGAVGDHGGDHRRSGLGGVSSEERNCRRRLLPLLMCS